MKRRWLPISVLLLSAALVGLTIKLRYRSITVWYAEQYIVIPYLTRDRDPARADPAAQQDRDRVVRQLQGLGSPAVEAILRQLPEEKEGASCWFLFFEVVQNVPDSLPLLLANADNESAHIRAAVAGALGRYWNANAQIRATLQTLLNDSHESVRMNATLSVVFLNLDLETPFTAETIEGGSTIDDKSGRSDDLKLPDWWDPADMLPVEKSNCVRCHLTAGRELTAPVRDFARSVHDRAKMSCNDCHGGNTEDDTKAHEHEFDFIGTKLSAHMAACADCHTDEAEALRKGPHFWDLSKRINRDYPVCIDCHGNHDVGKPPAEFSLANVCTDCHKNLEEILPETAAVVAENDRLWKTLREVHAKNKAAADPTPAEFRRELAAVRRGTARLVHPAGQISKPQAESLNDRARRLRERLETWLKEHE